MDIRTEYEDSNDILHHISPFVPGLGDAHNEAVVAMAGLGNGDAPAAASADADLDNLVVADGAGRFCTLADIVTVRSSYGQVLHQSSVGC
jgi:high-affinity K+ transport system ATPase subunit B